LCWHYVATVRQHFRTFSHFCPYLLLILKMLINICSHTCWEMHPHTKSKYVICDMWEPASTFLYMLRACLSLSICLCCLLSVRARRVRILLSLLLTPPILLLSRPLRLGAALLLLCAALSPLFAACCAARAPQPTTIHYSYREYIELFKLQKKPIYIRTQHHTTTHTENTDPHHPQQERATPIHQSAAAAGGVPRGRGRQRRAHEPMRCARGRLGPGLGAGAKRSMRTCMHAHTRASPASWTTTTNRKNQPPTARPSGLRSHHRQSTPYPPFLASQRRRPLRTAATMV
jgi:hypothetical protein